MIPLQVSNYINCGDSWGYRQDPISNCDESSQIYRKTTVKMRRVEAGAGREVNKRKTKPRLRN